MTSDGQFGVLPFKLLGNCFRITPIKASVLFQAVVRSSIVLETEHSARAAKISAISRKARSIRS